MSLRVLDGADELAARLRRVIETTLPDARVEVSPTAPGHFAIRVVAEAFRGRSPLQQHQVVYGAIAPLMQGPSPPVHAIDRLETSAP